MSERDELQTLGRGLEALAVLNETGLTKLTTLARRLGLPRTTTYRIVNTLIAEGYCVRIPHSSFYQATPACWRLSQGVNEGEILTSVSISVIERLGADVKWPVTLATPQGSTMLVRFTTDRTTSLAISRFNPGFQADMLNTTTGLLYLALERPDVSQRLMEDLLSHADMDAFALSNGRLEARLRACREDGYLILAPAFHPEACVGVPILLNGAPIGGLVMRYIKVALTRSEIVENYLPKLQRAAAEISRLYGIAVSRTGQPRQSQPPSEAEASKVG